MQTLDCFIKVETGGRALKSVGRRSVFVYTWEGGRLRPLRYTYFIRSR